MDGTMWIGDELTPRAGEAIAAIREAGKGLAFVTNNPRRAAEDYVQKMWRLGIPAAPRGGVAVGGAAQPPLPPKRPGGPAVVVGSGPLPQHATHPALKVLK